ncbi:E3 ubiquitin ligase family protein [Amycolatopsis palatopharyngis]|uniref:E3 ubiquitin ligase family protein n=1 Tax=Amycolatopsis palatopharyngis TaxID=187982 RepID=UPI000E25F13C|nr:E3 ubiquitin ligase family protein [Amycolatopsis palatopharyngis]
MWILIGLLLVAAGVAGFFYMQHTKRELHAMIGTDTLTIPQLEDLRRISDDLGAIGGSDAERLPLGGGGRRAGGFRKVAGVVGTAHPRPEGPLVSEVSKSECVWYRYRIDRQYEHVEYRDGRRHRSKRTEKVVEHTSAEGYALIDEQGRTIGVDPNGTSPDGVEQSVNRFEPHHGRGGHSELFGIRLPAALGGGRDSTLGYEYKEWLIRPGRRMYILGEVHDKIGPLVIGKPEQGGHFLISTRTEHELRADRVQRHKFLAVGVIVAVVGGVAAVIGGLVS